MPSTNPNRFYTSVRPRFPRTEWVAILDSTRGPDHEAIMEGLPHKVAAWCSGRDQTEALTKSAIVAFALNALYQREESCVNNAQPPPSLGSSPSSPSSPQPSSTASANNPILTADMIASVNLYMGGLP